MTLKIFYTGMGQHVSGEISSSIKTPTTYFALKRLLSSVGSHMLFEIGCTWESLPTVFTDVIRHAWCSCIKDKKAELILSSRLYNRP